MNRNLKRAFRRCFAASLFSLAACGGKNNAAQDTTAAANADPNSELMARGVDLLYKAGNPVAAAAIFREVLQRNPTHYGAHYQLAVALDRSGKPAGARPLWDSVAKFADAMHDTATARTAAQRLAAPDTASQEGMMALGLDLLYQQKVYDSAVAQFQKVLQRNPNHYGATYQLAVALEKSGKVAEARNVWQKVLGMATAINDKNTAATARQRLAGVK